MEKNYLMTNVAPKLILDIYRSPKPKTLFTYSSKGEYCYNYLLKLSKTLEKEGITIRTRKGQGKFIKLTEKGTQIAQYLEKIRIIMERENEQ